MAKRKAFREPFTQEAAPDAMTTIIWPATVHRGIEIIPLFLAQKIMKAHGADDTFDGQFYGTKA